MNDGKENANRKKARGRKVMNSGIYYVIFTSYTGIFVDGLAVFDNGNIHGGDNRYLYRGHYIVEGNSLTAKIQVSYYRGKFESLFGPVDKYDLTLSGNAGEDTFKMSGHISGWSERQITIEGQKQADLVTQPSPPLRPSLHPYPSPA
jgi:hypothetical protein